MATLFTIGSKLLCLVRYCTISLVLFFKKISTRLLIHDTTPSIKFPSHITDKTLVVFIFGWVGSETRQMTKYQDLYLRKDCITITCGLPGFMEFLRYPNSTKRTERAIECLKVLEENKLSTNLIMFHVFSNGGFNIYRNFLKIQLQSGSSNVIGAVLDSCPSEFSLELGRGSIVADLKGKWGFSNSLAGLVTWPIFCAYRLHLATIAHDVQEMKEIMLVTPDMQWPHLFLYSQIDTVIGPEHVGAAMEQLRQYGNASVKGVDFKDSKHVLHLRKYPQLYEEECEAFLQSCLRDKRNTATL